MGVVYAPPGAFDWDRGAVRALRRALEEHGVSVEHVIAGDRFRVGEAVVEVLHPPEGTFGEHDNAASMVLSVEYAGRRIVLPGDVEEEGLDLLLRSPRRPCEVLVAPSSRQSEDGCSGAGSVVFAALGCGQRLSRGSDRARGAGVPCGGRGGAVHGRRWGGDRGDGG